MKKITVRLDHLTATACSLNYFFFCSSGLVVLQFVTMFVELLFNLFFFNGNDQFYCFSNDWETLFHIPNRSSACLPEVEQ